MQWYLKSAELGNGNAMYMLGWKYEHGNGVEQSDEQALQWYRRAAEQGSEDAKQALERFPSAQ